MNSTPKRQDVALWKHLGQVLFGSRWEAEMSRLLSIEPQVIVSWHRDSQPIPGWVWAVLDDRLAEHHAQICDMLNDLNHLSANT